MESLGRIAVVGTSCAGKSTLARALGRALDLPHTELDTLHWGPGWTGCSPEVLRGRVGEAVARERWVIDGNYARVRDLVWGRATAVVWLDYPFPLVFRRAVVRTLRRALTREEVFPGCRESLAGILDPEWIPWWVVRTHLGRRRRYRRLLAEPAARHLDAYVLRDPADAERFLDACGRGATDELDAMRARRPPTAAQAPPPVA